MSHWLSTLVRHRFHPSLHPETLNTYLHSYFLSFVLWPVCTRFSLSVRFSTHSCLPLPLYFFLICSFPFLPPTSLPWCNSLLHEDLISVCKLNLSSSLPVDFKGLCHQEQLLTCPPSPGSVLSESVCVCLCVHVLCTCECVIRPVLEVNWEWDGSCVCVCVCVE